MSQAELGWIGWMYSVWVGEGEASGRFVWRLRVCCVFYMRFGRLYSYTGYKIHWEPAYDTSDGRLRVYTYLFL